MTSILFLTRGHGYGHAANDLQFIRTIQKTMPDIDITIASSGTGLEYYRNRGVDCLDIGIPDENDQGPEATKMIASFLFEFIAKFGRPDLVVANEVFAAPRICHLVQLRNILVTQWFFAEIGSPQYDLLMGYAAAIIILDFAEAHQVPHKITIPVHFVGAIARKFNLEQSEARNKLGLSSTNFVMTLAFGSVRLDKIPDIRIMINVVTQSWRCFTKPGDTLLILAEPSKGYILTDMPDIRGVRWIGIIDDPAAVYCAADIVVAYATFTTLSELARNNIPTVGIIGSINPVDKLHANFMHSTGHIRALDIETIGEKLCSSVHDAMRKRPLPQTIVWGDYDRVAQIILSYLPDGTARTKVLV